MDSEFLKLGSYLQRISDIERKCEENQKKLIEGEKEKSELEEEIIKLDKAMTQLNRDLEEKANELGQAQAKICILNSENTSLLEMKQLYTVSRKNEDSKLWDISQSVYSDIVKYCDKVQEFTENNSLTNLVKPYLYPCQETNRKKSPSEEIMQMKEKKIKELKEINVKLKLDLSELKEKHKEFLKLQERRTFLKYDLLKGKDFLDVQVALKESRDTVKILEAKVCEIEKKEQQKHKTASVPNDIEVTFERNLNHEKAKQQNLQNSIKSTSDDHQRRPASCFVPKVPSKRHGIRVIKF